MSAFNMKILPGLTTTKKSDWRAKINEIDRLGLQEIALFPTCLKPNERQELYEGLEKTSLQFIPHVHLRNDVTHQEIEYLIGTYKTKVLNHHSEKEFPILFDWSDYTDIIYIENSEIIPTAGELSNYAGLCLDFAHWENGRMREQDKYSGFSELANQFPIGCGHISAIRPAPEGDNSPNPDSRQTGYDSHWLNDLSELDYLTKYQAYLPSIISIELENPLATQLEAIAYLNKLLK
jgi:hypothetical protein